MTIEAELHDGRVLEFPDGTAPEVVQATVKKMLAPPEKSTMQKVDDVARSAFKLTPMGFLADRTKGALEGLDRASYKSGEAVSDLATSVSGKRSLLNPGGFEIPPEVAAGAGAAANMTVGAVPAIVGGGVSKAALSPSLQSSARNWMQSAMKPSYEQIRSGDAAKAITTMLKEGINVSEGGVAKLKGKIDELNNQIVEAIKASPATVDKDRVANVLAGELARLKGAVSGVYDGMQANPQARIKAIEEVWTKFINQPALLGKQEMPVLMAQKMKQGTYKELEGKYGELESGVIEAQKGIARGLKEGVERAVPSVGPANKAEGELINALEVMHKRATMDANRNPGGLAWITHDLPQFIAMITAQHPAAKSAIARALYSPTAAAAPGELVGATAGAYTGRKE